MALELAESGSKTLSAAEQDLFVSQTVLQHYSTKIFFDELLAGDEVLIRVFDEDVNGVPEEKLYRTFPVEGPQTNPMLLVNWIPSSSYRVTCQQITGAPFKTITFALYTS